MRIWRGDPTAVSAAISAVLAFVLTLNTWDLTQEKIGVTMGVVNAVLGLLTAYVTRRTVLGLVMTVANSLAAFVVAFNLDFLTADQTGAALAVIPFIFGLFHWSATSPLPAGGATFDTAT